MAKPSLPPAIDQQNKRLEQLYTQVRLLQAQLTQLEAELRQTETALKELDNLEDDTTVYKTVGMLLFKTEKPTIKEELTDQKETLDLRVKTIRKQEEQARKKFEELREILTRQLKAFQEEDSIAG